MNERFQNALRGVPQKVPPIWFMRQAGRYHWHYQQLRKQYSFMQLCKLPELAAQTALGPIADFDFDVAILFSDLLFPLEALGLGLEYTDQGPRLGRSLNEQVLRELNSPAQAILALEFQARALEQTRALLPANKSLIGFVGGPWTLFGYAVEGSHRGHLIEAKRAFALYHKFCEVLVPLLLMNIELQLDAGAELVMVMDTAAGELSPVAFAQLQAAGLEKIVAAFAGRLGYYSKGTTADHLRRLSPNWAGWGVDHRFDLAELLSARSASQRRAGFVQGNFDQAQLFLPADDFRTQLNLFLEPLRRLDPNARAGWVCGLGHGVLPLTPADNVRDFVRLVRESFAQ